LFTSQLAYFAELFVVSVTNLQWYDEDKRFAIGFSDGVVYLSTKDDYLPVIVLNAHEVSLTLTILIYL